MPLFMVKQQTISQVRQRRPIGFCETLPITVEVRRDLQPKRVLFRTFGLALREFGPQPARDAVTANSLKIEKKTTERLL